MSAMHPWERLLLAFSGLLATCVIVGCASASPARRTGYRELVAWLEANALPQETVGLQQHHRLWASLTDQPSAALPPGRDAHLLLAQLQETRPGYCVALRSVAWDGVRADLWFQDHYWQVATVTVADDPASPLTLYRYRYSPFDEGEAILLGQRLQNDAVGYLTIASVRVNSPRLAPSDPIYVSLVMAGNCREALQATWQLREISSNRVWTKGSRPQPGGAATSNWPVNSEVLERFTIIPPDGLPSGDFALELAFTRPNGAPFAEPVMLAALYHPWERARILPQPDHVVSIQTEDSIELIGYDAPEHIEPGGKLSIALYWRANGTPDRDYKAFIHVLAPSGVLVAQSDAIPAQWRHPTTTWEHGDYIRDVHNIQLDARLPRGDYQLMAGMYDLETEERLALYDGQGQLLTDDVMPLSLLRVR